jgi:hypothetical protein
MAYPGAQQRYPTPAPQGKRPFYISHYGRYGSHHLLQKEDYDTPYKILTDADKAGKLTAKGRDVIRRLDKIRNNAFEQWGELTQTGARQQQMIAQRMVEHFPEVFDARTVVDARSTTVGRCILSMEHFLLQLLRMKPYLNILHNATHRDMYFLNQQDKQLMASRMDSVTKEQYNKFARRYDKFEPLMRMLFNDQNYVKQHIDARKLNDDLYSLASNIQNTELRKHVTLYDIFSDADLYRNWMKDNAWWYINYGGYMLNGGHQPYTQRNLLRKFISEADSCIRLRSPGAQLRFGHETVLLPLVCLLGINGFDLQTANLEELEPKGWWAGLVFPMASNIQFVFYRRNRFDSDVVFKVLLNEQEATLPIETDMAPYYHWRDFRKHYLKMIDDYEKR